MYKNLLGGNDDEGASLLSRVCTERTRSNRHKSKHVILPLHIRKQLLIVRGDKHWHRLLPVEVVESPSLELFKTQENSVLGKLLWAIPLEQRGWAR